MQKYNVANEVPVAFLVKSNGFKLNKDAIT